MTITRAENVEALGAKDLRHELTCVVVVVNDDHRSAMRIAAGRRAEGSRVLACHFRGSSKAHASAGAPLTVVVEEHSRAGASRVARGLLLLPPMSFTKCSFALALTLGLMASTANAGPYASIRVAPETAPASIDAETRAAFRHAVTASLAEAGIASIRTYTVHPAIVQLRRYIEPGEKSPTLVCVISIAVSDDQSVLIAAGRGSATSRNATTLDVVEVASQSAVRSLAKALNSASKRGNKP